MTRATATAIRAVQDVAPGHTPTVAVVIACYSERRWPALQRLLDSVEGQSHRPDRVLVVVDNNDVLRERLTRDRPEVTVLANSLARGAGGARTTGGLVAGTDFIAFLDDDVVADPRWLATLLAIAASSTAAGIGGGVEPVWAGQELWWFPREFDWVFGLRRRGSPGTQDGPVRNVWAENMFLRTADFAAAGGFRAGFGKVGARSEPEDTELCLRLSQMTGRPWLLAIDALVRHEVPHQRATLSFFLRRCWMEGAGKAALGDERDYVRKILALGFVRHMARSMLGRPAELVQAGVIALGLAMTIAGYVAARVATIARNP